MLSLGQSISNFNTNYAISSDGLVHYNNFSSSYFQAPYQLQQQLTASSVPLTPPGSPEDAPLVICDSPPKTPYKKRMTTIRDDELAMGGGLSGDVISNFYQSALSDACSLAYGSGTMNSHATLPIVGNADCGGSPNAFCGYISDNRPASILSTISNRRSRGEKKPIPDVMKDEKYFERRRRNNVAAKKSRDNRKSREEEISSKAACLERENAILRAQVVTLREEAHSLRLLLLQKRDRQLSVDSISQIVQSSYGGT